MTMTIGTQPRVPALPRDVSMRLATTEYQRFLDLLRVLRPDDWTRPTDCPDWDVRAVAAHVLGMVEMTASFRESNRQMKLARGTGGLFIDALTALQVAERADMLPTQVIDRYAARAPKAARARRRTPALIRHRPMPIPQRVGDHDEPWTIGYLIDVILTRDPWMHRVDIVRATAAPHRLTAGHDGLLVADVVGEWADRHGRPYTLRLTGPAGGEWTRDNGPLIEMDAVEFCRALSGRTVASGLLTTQVPF